MDLYAEEILDRYRNPLHKGTLQHPDASAHDSNPLCGDDLSIAFMLDKSNKISKIVFSGVGCAISQASADLLCELAEGKTLKEIVALQKSDALKLLGVPISAVRLKCALLSLKVLKMAAYTKLGLDAKNVGWE